jgi:serine protease Do
MMMNKMNKNENENENENEKFGKARRLAKKGLSISLCAVLAGGLAAGAYHGVNTVTGWNQIENVSAAAQNDESVTLLKAKSNSDSEDTEAEEDTETEETAESAESTSAGKGSLDVSDIVEQAMPFVVSITTKSIQEVESYYGYFQYGYGYAPQQEQEVEGSGSGIIVGKNDNELLVVTNYHVVEGAETVTVSFVDGETYEATAKGYDSDRDLAVVAVSLDDLSSDTLGAISVATIGSSDDLKVGEQVVAIGNAMGYGQSVTTGIVSAKNRRLSGDTVSSDDDDDDAVNLIQTDAAINPGNSGGALLNMNGEVVGINSAKLASTEVEGMGYAIAISDVSGVLEQLMNETPRDKVEGAHGIIGIMGTTVSDEGHSVYGMPEGVFVSEVTEGGPSEAAGIKKNSVITKFDGKRVRSIDELVELLEYYEPGEEVEVTYQVMDGEGYEEKTATVTLGESDTTDTDEEEASEQTESDADGDDEGDGSEIQEEDEEDAFGWGSDSQIPDISEFFGNHH